jgi:hypothetical protein
MAASQRLSSFFAGNAALHTLARKSQELAALDRLYRTAIPPSLAGGSRVVNLERNVLRVGADNSAIAAKLRQLAPQILLRIQETNAEITGILVKVQVGQPARKPTRPPHVVGRAGKEKIADLASTLDNSPLRAALLRLIKH